MFCPIPSEFPNLNIVKPVLGVIESHPFIFKKPNSMIPVSCVNPLYKTLVYIWLVSSPWLHLASSLLGKGFPGGPGPDTRRAPDTRTCVDDEFAMSFVFFFNLDFIIVLYWG